MTAWKKTRVVETTVGEGLDGIGRKAWAVQEFRECDCPDCEADGHWLAAGHSGWYYTRAGAVDVAKMWGIFEE